MELVEADENQELSQSFSEYSESENSEESLKTDSEINSNQEELDKIHEELFKLENSNQLSIVNYFKK